jgi:hypothetical protein
VKFVPHCTGQEFRNAELSLGKFKVQGSKHILVIQSLGHWVKLKAQRLTVENVGIVKSVEIAPVK